MARKSQQRSICGDAPLADVDSLIGERSLTSSGIFRVGATFITRPASSKLARRASCRATKRSMACVIFSIEMLPVKRTVMDSL